MVGPAHIPQEHLVGTEQADSKYHVAGDKSHGAVVATVPLGIGRRQRGLANATHSMDRRDGDATLVVGEGAPDLDQDLLTPEEIPGNSDRDIGSRAGTTGERDRSFRNVRRWLWRYLEKRTEPGGLPAGAR